VKDKKRRGIFITFEGPDGSGKTTQIKFLANFLKQKGYKVSLTREPGGTKIGEKIRKILLSPSSSGMTNLCEFLLYAAARAQHVNEKILPLLKKGGVVLSDRFSDSSYAYQGKGRGIEIKFIEYINKTVTRNLVPDITFLLSVKPDKGLKRVKKRVASLSKTKTDRLENEKISFHRRVMKGYFEVAKKYPERFVVIPAGLSIKQTSKIIIKNLIQRGIINGDS